MQPTNSTETLPEAAYDEKTLELARKILALTIAYNDMAQGVRATAYALLLLNRLIHHFDKPDEELPTDCTLEEEERIGNLLEEAYPEMLERTGGKPLKLVVQGLFPEASKDRIRPPFGKKFHVTHKKNRKRR